MGKDVILDRVIYGRRDYLRIFLGNAAPEDWVESTDLLLTSAK